MNVDSMIRKVLLFNMYKNNMHNVSCIMRHLSKINKTQYCIYLNIFITHIFIFTTYIINFNF